MTLQEVYKLDDYYKLYDKINVILSLVLVSFAVVVQYIFYLREFVSLWSHLMVRNFGHK